LWVEDVLRFPRTDNKNLKNDEWLGTTLVRSVEHNVEIPARYFMAQ
jgi:hypothetical protein